MGHFMNNSYDLEIKARKHIPHNERIPQRVKDDLQTIRKFLSMVNKGIS